MAEPIESVLEEVAKTQSPEFSDMEIVGRVRNGEIALFEILMRRYNQRVYRACRAILRDDSEAEDVMQDAYVRAYTHLGQFENRASFSTWLTRIAVHEALARKRRARRFEWFDETTLTGQDPMKTLGATQSSPERQAYDAELKQILEAALDTLPESYRSVFVLREVEGMSTADTAACLDLGEEAVKVRLHRARAMLRKDLFARTGAATAAAFQFHLSRCDRVVASVFKRIAEEAVTPGQSLQVM